MKLQKIKIYIGTKTTLNFFLTKRSFILIKNILYLLKPSRCEFRAQNSQREGRSLSRQGRDHFSQWGMGISVGFFTETTTFIRNPGVQRSPSYWYVQNCPRKIDPSIHPSTKIFQITDPDL